MKTSTAARTTAASAKQRPSGKSGGSKQNPLEIRKFTVSERWVEITAKILEEDAQALRPEALEPENAHGIFKTYSTSLFIAVDAFKRTGERSVTWFDFRMDGNRWHRSGMRRKKQVQIRFSVKESDWLHFLSDCKVIESEPDELIAAAFGSRAKRLGMPGHRRKGGEA